MTGLLVAILECAVVYLGLLMNPPAERRRVTYRTPAGDE